MAERVETVAEGHGGDGAETEVPRVASGIHSEDSVIDVESRVGTESPVYYGEPLAEGTPFKSTEPTELSSSSVSEEVQPEPPNTVITPDGVQELPPWLIGSDGKPLPLNERTLRLIRGKTFTVRHDVAVCGHKFDRINQPKRNCHVCWWAFFQTHELLVKTAHEFYQQFGKERLVALRGRVFVKYFHMFMSTVQHLLEQQKAQEAANGNSAEQNVGCLGDGTICEEAGEGNA